MNDSDIVRLCAAIYQAQPGGFWDHYWDGSDPDGICAGIKDNTLICRGSYDLEDWERDFEVIRFGQPFYHPQFGPVHAGMDLGLDQFFQKASQFLGAGAAFGGHSLGAARAAALAGRYILAGGTPGRTSLYGCPRYGTAQFAGILKPFPGASFRNGADPVPEVPLLIGIHVAADPIPLQAVRIEPTDWTEGLMAFHNINLYIEGVANG
jgi:hypothetical protein